MLGRLLVRTLFGFPYVTPKRWVSKERILAADLNVLSENLDDINARFGALIPTGVIWAWGGGTTPPAGWLLCDGASYNTGVYPTLFGVIGYAYGGSGSTFYVPDTRGRLLMGAGAGPGLTARTAGAVGGVERVALSVAEMPSHDHGDTVGRDLNHYHYVQHQHSADDNWTGEHRHPIGGDFGHRWAFTYNGANDALVNQSAPNRAQGLTFSQQDLAGGHDHNITVGNATRNDTDWSTNDRANYPLSHNHDIPHQGGGGTHDNMPPFVVTRAIIKT